MGMANAPYEEPKPQLVWCFRGIDCFSDPTLKRGIIEVYDRKGECIGRIENAASINVGESN